VLTDILLPTFSRHHRSL